MLRMAAIAPDGTSWARELKAFARGVEAATGGAVRMKWYLGGIAGDEQKAIERIRRDQLDGAAGAMMCEILAPSLRVTRVAGLLQSRADAKRVLNHLSPDITAEFHRHGFVFLASSGFGLDILFTRRPVRTLAELRRGKYWIRSYDDVLRETMKVLGVELIELPYAEAAAAYDAGKVDGFVASPVSALAFRWAGQVRAYTDVKLAYLPACLGISIQAFDKLSLDQQRAVRTEAALMEARFEAAGREFDRQLIDDIFAQHGLIHVVPSAEFRSELENAFKQIRTHLDPSLVPPALLQRVRSLLGHSSD
jgi:TRAP-type C4-dicarboxylate transport system substrate-binding protein